MYKRQNAFCAFSEDIKRLLHVGKNQLVIRLTSGMELHYPDVYKRQAPVLENMQRVTVQNIDRMLIELDNTKNKEKLGANATLAEMCIRDSNEVMLLLAK